MKGNSLECTKFNDDMDSLQKLTMSYIGFLLGVIKTIPTSQSYDNGGSVFVTAYGTLSSSLREQYKALYEN